MAILSISGYQSLNYLPAIFISTKRLGIVNKECIVAAGHLFNKINKNNNTKIFPLDSEHYSLRNILLDKYHNIKNCFLTASGGTTKQSCPDEPPKDTAVLVTGKFAC